MLGVISSALSFIGGVHIGTRALFDINFIWFAISLANPSGRRRVFLLVQMISIAPCGLNPGL
jgi:hypothetical protein